MNYNDNSLILGHPLANGTNLQTYKFESVGIVGGNYKKKSKSKSKKYGGKSKSNKKSRKSKTNKKSRKYRKR